MKILMTRRRAAFNDRRGGKDRRKYIDPRYRNSTYFEFVDRRKSERRAAVYEPDYRLIKEHPETKWVTRIGMIVLLFLIYLLLLSNLVVCKGVGERTKRKCTIRVGCFDVPE
jgi:hypothetical protein